MVYADRELSPEYREAFKKHTQELGKAIIGFCMNAATEFTKNKGEKLTDEELTFFIHNEILSVVQQFQMPNYIEAMQIVAFKRFREADYDPKTDSKNDAL